MKKLLFVFVAALLLYSCEKSTGPEDLSKYGYEQFMEKAKNTRSIESHTINNWLSENYSRNPATFAQATVEMSKPLFPLSMSVFEFDDNGYQEVLAWRGTGWSDTAYYGHLVVHGRYYGAVAYK